MRTRPQRDHPLLRQAKQRRRLAEGGEGEEGEEGEEGGGGLDGGTRRRRPHLGRPSNHALLR